MTYTRIETDMLIIPGLLPRGGRTLPVPGMGADTIEAEPTATGLDLVVDGQVVTIPWERVHWTRRAAPAKHAPGAEAFARAVVDGTPIAQSFPVAQPPPRMKRR